MYTSSMQRYIYRPPLLKRSAVQYQQHRQFLFLIVPIIGAGMAIVIGGALVIYGMETYRKYQLKNDIHNEKIKVEPPIRKGEAAKKDATSTQ